MARMVTAAVLLGSVLLMVTASADGSFDGRFYSGKGDVEYLQLLDISRRMFDPDPEFQNVSMLYTPAWNGFVEGPTWNAWWIQNSYGPTYCALPFYEEPYISFLQRSHDLWFDQMGDGQRVGYRDWVAPDGCLCDAASPGWIVYKQGDGRVDIHDWGMEFTAAGLLMQAELLLISRDRAELDHYLPMLERCARFIESRRDPKTDLYLAGPAGNLLAPSYAGYKRSDGTYGMAYLTGLSVTFIAALDRLIEAEKLAGREQHAAMYREWRERARGGLERMRTDEGYYIRSLDPDGTPHGVYGAGRHGYFESSPNHDAICFRVADDTLARRIYKRIVSIPGLRPHGFIIPNHPSYDDMYEKPEGLWEFGRWVNGGHWSTCEARMIMAYYRLGEYEDARRSMNQLLTFARRFRMDNPLTEFGNNVYQPKEPIDLCYDSFGPPAAMVRGLFEYRYAAEGLLLHPHIPPGITELQQKFPIRFGEKRLYLTTTGAGPVTGVRVNGREWKHFDEQSVRLPYEETPDVAFVQIELGDGSAKGRFRVPVKRELPAVEGHHAILPELAPIDQRARAFHKRLRRLGLGDTYEAAHARLIVEAVAAARERQRLLVDGSLERLDDPASQEAADRSYMDTVNRLNEGLVKHIDALKDADDPRTRRIRKAWEKSE